MINETVRLIALLEQREEYCALPEKEYYELLTLLERELERTKNLDWWYQ